MINVTKPFFPPLDEYRAYLEDIWKREWITNNGPLVNELELKLKRYLNLDHLLFLGNGTIALQIAIKALDLKGEIITTPFSFVATTSSIVWEGCRPVFVDIEPSTLNIDPAKIEAAITPSTSAILATHVFGNPCAIDAINEIALKNDLKVIYDGAHAFGTKYKGKSIFSYGDITTTSFHATKLFHTGEGGAVVTSSADLLKKMSFMRNFGHNGPENFAEVGINGKNSELHAALGLVNLNYIDQILRNRQNLCEYYVECLQGMQYQTINITEQCTFNYAYFPILLDTEEMLLKVQSALNANWIYPRRYFYPSLSRLQYVQRYETPISDLLSKRILCLPLYYGLKHEDIAFITRIILRTVKY